MPYTVVEESGPRPFKIKKHGKTVGSSKTREAAEASIRARNAAAHGAKMGKKR